MNKMNSEPLSGQEITGEELQETVKPKRNWLRRVLMLIVPALLLGVGGYWWRTSGKSVSTDNAAVKQDITSVGAQVTGPISEVFVKEGERQGSACYWGASGCEGGTRVYVKVCRDGSRGVWGITRGYIKQVCTSIFASCP